MATAPRPVPELSAEEREALRAVYERLRTPVSVPFEVAIQWPTMLPVLRCARRGFDSRKQSLAHPCQAATVHAAVAHYRPLTPPPTHAREPTSAREEAPACARCQAAAGQ